MAEYTNPYSVKVVNPLEALMLGEQGYKDARVSQSEQEQKAARQAAQEALMSGDTRGALARLIGANDPKNAAVLSSFESAANGQNGVFGTPIYGTRADGTTAIGTFDKQGRFREIQTPGFSPTPGIKTIDTGTGTLIIDGRTGQPVRGGPQGGAPMPAPGQPGMPAPQVQGGYVPKDVSGEARDKKYGTEQGDAKATLSSLRAKLPGLTKVVSALNALSDKATYTTAGQWYDTVRKEIGANPRDAAIARTRYISMVDNQVLPMLRDTFGAAFTVKEGDTLRATLGDPNKTPAEKKAVLESFIQQKVRDVEALEAQTAGQQPSRPQSDPVRVRTPDEARRLPSGTPIMLPDGSMGRVP